MPYSCFCVEMRYFEYMGLKYHYNYFHQFLIIFKTQLLDIVKPHVNYIPGRQSCWGTHSFISVPQHGVGTKTDILTIEYRDGKPVPNFRSFTFTDYY